MSTHPLSGLRSAPKRGKRAPPPEGRVRAIRVASLCLMAWLAACGPGPESRTPARDSVAAVSATGDAQPPAPSETITSSPSPHRDSSLRRHTAPVDPGPAPAGAIQVLGRLPDVVARDLSGGKRNLRALVDSPTVVNFWATWCGPCEREMPELGALHEELRERGAGGVIGIAIDSGKPGEIRQFAEAHGANYLQLRATRRWADRHFRLFGMPTTLVVDSRGRIRARLVGPQTRESVMRKLDPLL